MFYLDIKPEEFNIQTPFPYYSKSDILPKNIALKAQNEILNLTDEKWDRYQNPFEHKYTLRDKNNLPPNVECY